VGLTIISTNLPSADFPLKFSYDPAGALTVATDAGLDGCPNPDNSICLFIAPSIPGGGDLIQITSAGDYYSSSGSDLVVSEVPEPAAWSLMMVGIGGLGAVVRSRRQRES
jgi:hypothetical protein